MIQQFVNSSYFVVLIFLIIIIILFYIRHRLSNVKNHPSILLGSAQCLGKRKDQEDCCSCIMNDMGILAVLADGMGGYSNGKIASNVAVKTFIDAFSKAENIYPVEDFLTDTSVLSNLKICESGNGEKIGTTLAVVIITGNYLYWAAVGDSAMFIFRKGDFIYLNKKHIFESVLEEKLISGKITREEMVNNSKKNRLTNYMGHKGFKEVEVCSKAIQLRQGDKIILCSDGVYNSINEIELEGALSKKIKPKEAAEEIINIIKGKNSPKQDNATVVILEKK